MAFHCFGEAVHRGVVESTALSLRRCARLYPMLTSRLRRWRLHRQTLRDVAYLDDRSLRELGIVATSHLRAVRAWRNFPFD
jgi:hypothetical protein